MSRIFRGWKLPRIAEAEFSRLKLLQIVGHNNDTLNNNDAAVLNENFCEQNFPEMPRNRKSRETFHETHENTVSRKVEAIR